MPTTPLRRATVPLAELALPLWRGVRLGALVIALVLDPQSWRMPWRQPLAAQLVRTATPLLPWFTMFAAIVTLVVGRIVLVTAQSYGLDRYALEVVVRVLVLELIPLSAGLAVAVRASLPLAGELLQLRRQGRLDGAHALRTEIAPRAIACGFSVLLLAAAACTVALVLTYLLAHGWSPWAFERFTRVVGQIFTPAVMLVFTLKTLALALAVSVLPMSSALHDRDAPRRTPTTRADEPWSTALPLRGLVRLLGAILLIETVALAGNYA